MLFVTTLDFIAIFYCDFFLGFLRIVWYRGIGFLRWSRKFFFRSVNLYFIRYGFDVREFFVFVVALYL